MKLSDAKEKINQIEGNLNMLELVDWNEIFDNIPNSEIVKCEVLNAIYSASRHLTQLKKFFE
jgi:preprotein translocase subunit Sec63